MSKVLSSPGVLSVARWRRLFEAALLERDPKALPSRLHDAKHAVMDRVEESFKTASVAERRLLLAVLNTISERQRLSEFEELPRADVAQALDQAA